MEKRLKQFRGVIEILYLEHLLEMANIPTKYTGLYPTVMVSSKYTHDGKESKHGPRIKISNHHGKFAPDDNFSLTVEDEPRVIGNCKLKKEHLEDAKDWIKLNKEHLHKVWHTGHDMDPVDLINGFKKL